MNELLFLLKKRNQLLKELRTLTGLFNEEIAQQIDWSTVHPDCNVTDVESMRETVAAYGAYLQHCRQHQDWPVITRIPVETKIHLVHYLQAQLQAATGCKDKMLCRRYGFTPTYLHRMIHHVGTERFVDHVRCVYKAIAEAGSHTDVLTDNAELMALIA